MMPTGSGWDDTQTSRARLMAAARMLFAKNGYEQVSTAVIAREAHSSESQLVRYFGSKGGLLQAIFNESWKPLNEKLQDVVADASTAHEALLGIFTAMVRTFIQDPDLAFLFLFEGRRLRGDQMALSDGYLEFINLMQRLIRRGQKDRTISSQFDADAIASALIGAAEGMIRDRLVAQRTGKPSPFSDREIRAIYTAFLNALSRD